MSTLKDGIEFAESYRSGTSNIAIGVIEDLHNFNHVFWRSDKVTSVYCLDVKPVSP